LECHSFPVLCWAYLQEVVFENNPSDHETRSNRCHVGIHGQFYIHLAFTSLWSLKRRVQRTWTGSAFSTNESTWNVMVMGSQSRV
jgi:hypothetical protein